MYTLDIANNISYIFDFDSTIIDCESLDELARLVLGRSPDSQQTVKELEAITAQGMAGTLAFDKSLAQRLQLFQATKDDLLALNIFLETRITLSLLAQKDWLAQNRENIYIVSGGFEECILPVAVSLGLLPENIYANRFVYEGARITGHDTMRLTGQAGGKVAQVRALNLPRPIVVIGDGYTDFEIKDAGVADEFWAFCGHVRRPGVVAEADRVLNDLSALQEEAVAI